MADFIIRIVGILLIATGMFLLGSLGKPVGIFIGLLLVIGAVVALFPSIFDVDNPD